MKMINIALVIFVFSQVTHAKVKPSLVCSEMPATAYSSVIREVQKKNAGQAAALRNAVNNMVQFYAPKSGSGFVAFKNGSWALIFTASHVARVQETIVDLVTGIQTVEYPIVGFSSIDTTKNGLVNFWYNSPDPNVPIEYSSSRLFTPQYSFASVSDLEREYSKIPMKLDFTIVSSGDLATKNMNVQKWKMPRLNEQVYTIGYADAFGLAISSGCVQRIDEDGSFVMSAQAYDGMSGGSVIDEEGHPLGIIVRSYDEKHYAVGISILSILNSIDLSMRRSPMTSYFESIGVADFIRTGTDLRNP